MILTSQEKAAILVERLIRFCDSVGSSVARIYKLIFLNQPISAFELEKYGLPKSTLYLGLNRLEKAGLIVEDRQGRWITIT